MTAPLEANARAQTHSQPEGESRCEGNAREEVGGGLVVACGDPTEVPEAAEGILDQVATAVVPLVVASDPLAVTSARDDLDGPASRSERRNWLAS